MDTRKPGDRKPKPNPFYLGMAYIMIFSPIFVERISAPLRYGMGVLFFLYGIFRAYRQYKDSIK